MFTYLLITFFLVLLYNAVAGLFGKGEVSCVDSSEEAQSKGILDDPMLDPYLFQREGGPQMFGTGAQLIRFDD